MPRTAEKPLPAREKLVFAGVDLFRRQGYVATPVDAICAAAGVSKGAFFHHFASKEALAEACMDKWDERMAGWDAGHTETADGSDAVTILASYMQRSIEFLTNPKTFASCLPGTTVQEISESHPALRDRANQSFTKANERFQTLLSAATNEKQTTVDTTTLAQLWIGTIQGALILFKASRDVSVIESNMSHVSQYILQQIGATDHKTAT